MNVCVRDGRAGVVAALVCDAARGLFRSISDGVVATDAAADATPTSSVCVRESPSGPNGVAAHRVTGPMAATSVR